MVQRFNGLRVDLFRDVIQGIISLFLGIILR